MGSSLKDIIIPSVAFFVAFYMVFTILELMIIMILNRLIFHYWGFFIDRVMAAKVYYGKQIETVTVTFLTLFLVAVIYFTSLADILFHAELGVQILAGLMVVAIILIYLLTSQGLPLLHVTKRIHAHLYIYMSVIAFVLIVTLANQHYASYLSFINDGFSKKNPEETFLIEIQKRKALLDEFRIQALTNNCPRVNFLSEDKSIIPPTLIYIATQLDLKLMKKPLNPKNPNAFLSGRLCSNGDEQFLLTDYGQWYWVFEGK